MISISGPDGSGKSTVSELLGNQLRELGSEPVTLWTRLGYTPGMERLKALARRLAGSNVPQRGETERRRGMMQRSAVRNLWLSLAAADFLVTCGWRVRMSTRRGGVTICDRYIWDALIDRRMYYPESHWVDKVILSGYRLLGRRPDCSILLRLPVEVAKDRSEGKKEPFPDPLEVRAARHIEYERLAGREDLHVIDATLIPDEVVSEILETQLLR